MMTNRIAQFKQWLLEKRAFRVKLFTKDPNSALEPNEALAHQREGWSAGQGKVPQSGSISSSLKQLAEIKAQRNGSEGDSAKHSLEEKRTNEN